MNPPADDPLLAVEDLRVSFRTPDGTVRAVRGVSFEVRPGETLAIVGESGSGKSVATQTVAGLTQAADVSGQAWFAGSDLLAMTPEQMRQVRGARIGMIFQDSQSSLHPFYRIGWQVAEAIRAHQPATSRATAQRRAVELLGRVGIPLPEQRAHDYPHQFSGGMRQRVMIAMAMALDPALLIADEPTTALDVTVQAQVLRVMSDLQREFGTAVVLITHDLGVVASVADHVVVMYAGAVMERAERRELFYRFHHPYTEGLLTSLPSEHGRRRLRPIRGQPPSLIRLPTGCPFHPRCPYVFDRCRTEVPPLRPVGGDEAHGSACWLPLDPAGRQAARAGLEPEARR
jgi:peptide/nickel transport system ATP-binding protein